MKILKELQTLLIERQKCKKRLENYIGEIKTLNRLSSGPSGMKGIDYSSDKVQSTSQIGFQDALTRLSRINSHIYLHEEELRNMEKVINEIVSILRSMNKLEYEVYILHCVEDMTFSQIANKLGYSERQIYRYWDKVK